MPRAYRTIGDPASVRRRCVGAPAHLLLTDAVAGTTAGEGALGARVAAFRDQASLFDDMGLVAGEEIDHAAVVDDRAAAGLPDAAAGAQEGAFRRQIIDLGDRPDAADAGRA